MLRDTVWNALHGVQEKFAVLRPKACRYEMEVAPFAAVADTGAEAVEQLRSLLAPGETIALAGEKPGEFAGLRYEQTIDCLQMVLATGEQLVPGIEREFVVLGPGDMPEMMALTTLTAPGPFRARTHEMGRYYGIREGGKLVAMAGERMAAGSYREISAVCTHPEYVGRGCAAALISKLAREHEAEGVIPFLHVAVWNERARQLYERLGFAVSREVAIHLLTRVEDVSR